MRRHTAYKIGFTALTLKGLGHTTELLTTHALTGNLIDLTGSLILLTLLTTLLINSFR